jgi:hypothetical protein
MNPTIRAFITTAYLLPMPVLSGTTTFTVNSTLDLPAASQGNGTCEATSGMGDCTLRAAVMEANGLQVPVVIIVPTGDYVLSLGQLQANGEMTIRGDGAGMTRIDGNEITRVLANNAILVLEALTIRRGRALDGADIFGGGLRNDGDLSLRRVIMEDNVANVGGAIFTGGALMVENSTFRNNDTQSVTSNSDGAAISASNAGVDIIGSTFHDNQPSTGESGFTATIHAIGGQLRILNSTISNNGKGGVQVHNGALDLRFSTLADNFSGNLNNFSFDGSQPTVLAANALTNAFSFNCSGSASARTSLGYNVVGDTSCALEETGDLQSANLMLGVLADNGGATLTHLPAATSPLVEHVPGTACIDFDDDPLIHDQRGQARPVGSGCDAGAVEWIEALIFQSRFEMSTINSNQTRPL